MTLRTAVVGGGTVSGVHLDGLSKNPRTSLAAICDTDKDAARDIAAEYGIDAYVDAEAMLADTDLDWAHICTPVQTHLPLAKLFIEAGVPIQIEKPITETYEEFEELAACADRHDVVVTEKHNHNFDPVMRAAMAQRRSGELGEVRGVDVVYTGSSRPDDANRGPWNFELAGGEFEEGVPHPVYLTLRAGGYPRSERAVTATTALFGDYDREFAYDSAQLQYVTENDVLCTTKVLGGTRPVRRVLVHGSEKSLTADLISQTLVEHDRDYKASAAARAMNNLDEAGDRLTGTVANARAVLKRKRNEDDWHTLRLLNAHYYQNDAESRALLGGDPDQLPVPLSESRWTMYLMGEIRNAAASPESRGSHPVEPTLGRDDE
ncbi:Gfo/Idh/MocA family protein [Halobacterium bonnevillei]|uniref:Gfo/Idh/MocA family oxidoreductase n=1 Tax=Halobacterium bonnevillei TaxID=2692200 RepID=A0A6B0SL38_9EURY|nr:Gfo/Idh/MocA family oxidoreductase [Halobacterium bonnevillei]MXR19622.1 Gfo/Idh/MocA family oxidoreductase [Halobacterium bonnevillei]